MMDPSRCYLKEIGNYPLLSAEQEAAAALALKQSRASLRQRLLASGYVQARVIRLLRRAHLGRVRLDSVLSFSRNQGRLQTLKCLLEQRLPQLESLSRLQSQDLGRLMRTRDSGRWNLLRSRLARRRRKIARLLRPFQVRMGLLRTAHLGLVTLSEIESQLAVQRREARSLRHGHPEVLPELARKIRDNRMRGREAPTSLRRCVARIEQQIVRYEEAKQTLVRGNLRLVVCLARRYRKSSLSMLDRVQEGNLGLMRAAERFCVSHGCRFSTYASWWIHHAIANAASRQCKSIRVPRQVLARAARLRTVRAELEQTLGRPPLLEEIARDAQIPERDASHLVIVGRECLSLDQVSKVDERLALADNLADPQENPATVARRHEELKRQVVDMLGWLDDRERAVIRLRYGLENGVAHTLAAVGEKFSLSRERIRQIEAHSMRKLKRSDQFRRLVDEEFCCGELDNAILRKVITRKK